MPLFQYDALKKNFVKIYSKSNEDISQSQGSREDTIKDLNRAGELSFVTPDGQKICCPPDCKEGAEKLAWLKMQIQAHLQHDEKLEAILKYVEENANQNGFLLAGQNGVNHVLVEKNITRNLEADDNDYQYNTVFGVTSDGKLSFTEICDLPKAMIQMQEENGEIIMNSISANSSLARLTTHSIIDTTNENTIAHTLENIEIKLNDKKALALFRDSDDKSDDNDLIADIENKVHASDNRGILKKISDYISEKFNKLTSPSLESKRPRP